MVSTKVTIVTTICTVAAVLAASILHLELVSLFMNTSPTYNLIRAGTLFVLVALLFVKPPRSFSIRAFLGVAGIALLSWSTNALFNTTSTFLDGLVFMAVAMVLEVEAFESQTSVSGQKFSKLAA